MIGTLGIGDFKIILHNLGKIISIASFAFILPLAWAYYFGEGEQIFDFFLSFIAALAFGLILWRVFRTDRDIKMRHAIAVTALSYPFISLFSALP